MAIRLRFLSKVHSFKGDKMRNFVFACSDFISFE